MGNNKHYWSSIKGMGEEEDLFSFCGIYSASNLTYYSPKIYKTETSST